MSKAKTPIVIKSKVLKGLLASNWRNFYTEDKLYESESGDFLKLPKGTKLTLYNKLNLATNSNFTVAKYVQENQTTIEKTSESVIKLIGQNNYDKVYSALSLVDNIEKKIKGILALLVLPKQTESVSCQTEFDNCDNIKKSDFATKVKDVKDSCCQTEESCIDIFIRAKQKKRIRRSHLTPYVVTDSPKESQVKKVVINPEEFKKLDEYEETQSLNSIQSTTSTDSQKCDSAQEISQLPNLGCSLDLNENSNDSNGKFSSISFLTTSEILNDPLSMINQNVDQNTQSTVAADTTIVSNIKLLDGTILQVPVKIEDQFHIASPEIMKCVPVDFHKNLKLTQWVIDLKFCLLRDDNDHLPIHVAAKNGDKDFLRRQCIMLKKRNESVDIPVCENNLQRTSLQISIAGDSPECTETLLQFGADPLVTDEEYRTCFHLAAEEANDHLKVLVRYAAENPMLILQQNEDLWSPELDQPKPKEYLAKYLLNKICTMNDKDGCTPLMLASKIGKHENVKTLLEASPGTVNTQMPSSGDTALYLAVHAACVEVSSSGNRSKPNENFKKTIEVLIDGGADPTIDNYSGVNINILLTDINVPEYSMIIANKLTSINCFNGEPPSYSRKPYMIIDNKDGSYSTVDVKEDEKKTKKAKTKKSDAKPIILENIKIEVTSPLKHKLKLDNCNETDPKKIKIETKPNSKTDKIEQTHFHDSFLSFVESKSVVVTQKEKINKSKFSGNLGENTPKIFLGKSTIVTETAGPSTSLYPIETQLLVTKKGLIKLTNSEEKSSKIILTNSGTETSKFELTNSEVDTHKIKLTNYGASKIKLTNTVTELVNVPSKVNTDTKKDKGVKKGTNKGKIKETLDTT